LAIAALCAPQPLAAQTTPAESAPAKTTSPWNTATAPGSPSPPADDDSALSLRVYATPDRRGLLPYRPRHDNETAYAVDVSAIMSRCADGRLVITGLLIGGQLTPLDSGCDADPGQIRGAPAPECDANRWRCVATPAK
jgi:hypothetical protein